MLKAVWFRGLATLLLIVGAGLAFMLAVLKGGSSSDSWERQANMFARDLALSTLIWRPGAPVLNGNKETLSRGFRYRSSELVGPTVVQPQRSPKLSESIEIAARQSAALSLSSRVDAFRKFLVSNSEVKRIFNSGQPFTFCLVHVEGDKYMLTILEDYQPSFLMKLGLARRERLGVVSAEVNVRSGTWVEEITL